MFLVAIAVFTLFTYLIKKKLYLDIYRILTEAVVFKRSITKLSIVNANLIVVLGFLSSTGVTGADMDLTCALLTCIFTPTLEVALGIV